MRLFSTAALACSRSGSARTRFGIFFLRDFDFGIGDGLLHRRRQLHRTAFPAAFVTGKILAPRSGGVLRTSTMYISQWLLHGSAKTRFGVFFLRGFDFGIGDGLLHRRRQLLTAFPAALIVS